MTAMTAVVAVVAMVTTGKKSAMVRRKSRARRKTYLACSTRAGDTSILPESKKIV